MTDYELFLREKFDFHHDYGFDVDPADLSPCLLPHQADIVRWAIKGGRRAIFAAFGLGKSIMQLEVMRLILRHLETTQGGGRALIVCPLGVRQEFVRDARDLLGISITFVRHTAEVDGPGLYLTNYESIRDGRLDPDLFDAVSLDEASVLRSYGSKTYQSFLGLFHDTKYRFVATATPSPNRYKELIHYAGFLGVMDTGAALTRWFRRDSTHANNLTLHPHKEAEFFVWLHSWAIFLQRPSDLGYSDEGYDLPELEVVWHEIPNDANSGIPDRDGQGRIFRDAALGVTAAAREKRDTLDARVAKAAEIVAASPGDHFILWHDLETERHALKAAMPEVVEVYGSLDLDTREERIIGFSDGEFRLLATKPTLSGSGCNFQRHCHRQVFVGVGFKFNDFIQALHRCHRYLQKHPVRIDVIYAESEREVVKTLRRKWAQHKELTEQMSVLIREHGLDQTSISKALERSLGIERVEISGEGWTLANNDCVLETRGLMKKPRDSMTDQERKFDDALQGDGGLPEYAPLPSESVIGENGVDLIVTSIPFGNQYEYVADYSDFGHTDDNDHFWAQMDFLTPELLRVLRPGRIYACHVKDRILFGNVTGAGYSTVSPFHAEALMHGLKHGFEFMGMITVVTDVVRENNQSYRLGWSEMAKDGTKMGVGSPEYVLLFRKPQSDRSRGYADVPVVKSKDDYSRARWQVDAHAFWRSNGNRPLTAEDMRGLTTGQRMKLFQEWSLANVHDHEVHVSIGEDLDGRAGMGTLPATFMMLAPPSPHPDVWTDVNRMRTLNTEQSRRDLVMHTCPLQYDIVDRLIERYSNPGELVFDPFAGLGTVPLRALRAGRKGRGVELNPASFIDSVRYLKAEEMRAGTPSLFDLIDTEASDLDEAVSA